MDPSTSPTASDNGKRQAYVEDDQHDMDAEEIDALRHGAKGCKKTYSPVSTPSEADEIEAIRHGLKGKKNRIPDAPASPDRAQAQHEIENIRHSLKGPKIPDSPATTLAEEPEHEIDAIRQSLKGRQIHPSPDPEEVRDDIERVRQSLKGGWVPDSPATTFAEDEEAEHELEAVRQSWRGPKANFAGTPTPVPTITVDAEDGLPASPSPPSTPPKSTPGLKPPPKEPPRLRTPAFGSESGVGGEEAPTRLVLCFDGTGNKFRGDASDTNVVKIYKLLDRTAPGAYHYYQPGIGTYINSTEGKQRGPFDRVRAGLEKTLDTALGTSFHDHVIAAYTFTMRYYRPSSRIYIFGFSRGAYTARFLAQMFHKIGLLSRGNEEMIRFAWRNYEKYERCTDATERAKLERYCAEFKKTFCREMVEIRFLGLFDCVNSVGSLEIPYFKRSFPVSVDPPAGHIRHAVSIDERRCKFRPWLFSDLKDGGAGHDLAEWFFPGDHCDVGGGWYPRRGRQRVLSDVPLAWMVSELCKVEEGYPEWDRLRLNQEAKDEIVHRFRFALDEPIHDILSFRNDEDDGFSGFFQRTVSNVGMKLGTACWWIMEIIPIFARMELVKTTTCASCMFRKRKNCQHCGVEREQWVPTRWPPNLGRPRDIPSDAWLHATAVVRKARHDNYKPANMGGTFKKRDTGLEEVLEKKRKLGWGTGKPKKEKVRKEAKVRELADHWAERKPLWGGAVRRDTGKGLWEL